MGIGSSAAQKARSQCPKNVETAYLKSITASHGRFRRQEDITA